MRLLQFDKVFPGRLLTVLSACNNSSPTSSAYPRHLTATLVEHLVASRRQRAVVRGYARTRRVVMLYLGNATRCPDYPRATRLAVCSMHSHAHSVMVRHFSNILFWFREKSTVRHSRRISRSRAFQTTQCPERHRRLDQGARREPPRPEYERRAPASTSASTSRH